MFIVRRLHFRDGHTVGVGGNLVAKLIAALVLAVHDHVNRLAIGRIGHAHTLADFKRKDVAHQGLVAIVVDERPLLCLGRTLKRRILQHVMALSVIELDAVGLLGKLDAGIATETGGYGIFLNPCAVVIDQRHVGLKVMCLVIRLLSRIDMNT